MAVSKRLRYEVLRRDGHKCRYCGHTASEAELAVDHVVPKSLGGPDHPSNLVTSCVDCNLGKATSIPDGASLPDVDQRVLDKIRKAAGRSPQFPYMSLFDSYLGDVVHALGGNVEAYKLSNEALWSCVYDAYQAHSAAVADGADDETAELAAQLELADKAAPYTAIIEMMPGRQQVANQPTPDDFPYMELFDVFLEDVMVSLGATQEMRRRANRALWDGFPEAHRAYDLTPKPSDEEDGDALDAAKAALMMRMSYYMPSVGLLLHKPESVDD